MLVLTFKYILDFVKETKNSKEDQDFPAKNAKGSYSLAVHQQSQIDTTGSQYL